MASKYSEKELAALEQKAKTPESKVLCPRCGNELAYREAGSSYEVKCPTEGCISLTVRGL